MTDLVPPRDAFADLNATIATLRQQLADRDSIVQERLASQAATIDVLQAMSASPGDAQPVLETIAPPRVGILRSGRGASCGV